MFWRSTLLAIFALSLVLVDDSLAQRGRGGGGGGGRDRGDRGNQGGRGGFQRGGGGSERGGGRDRGGDRRSRGNSTSSMLQSLDRNGNGQLDPSEMQGTAGRFIEPMLRNAGINTGRPVSIQELERLSGGGRDNNNRDRRGRDRDDDDAPLVLGFGNEFEDSMVPGFGPIDASVQVALNEEYDERTIRRVDFFLDRADTNHNGVLDRAEWEGLGDRYDTSEADKNQDGRITRLELAEQMAAEAQREEERRDRGRDRRRGDDDDDDNRDPRAMWGGGGDFGRGDFGRGDFGGRGGRGGRGRGGRGDFRGFEGGGGEWTQDEDGNWVQADRDDDDDDRRDRDRNRDRNGRGDEDEFESADHDTRRSYSLSGSSVERGTPSEFGQMDSSGDGQVSMSEFLSFDPQSLNARAAEFERMDTNGDGILSSNEYNVGTDRQGGGRPGGGRQYGRSRGGGGDDDENNSERENRGGDSQPASTNSNSSSSSSSSSSGDREAKYAASMVSSNDKNNNNVLEADEWPSTKLVDLNAADANGDGKLTVEEITAQLKK